MAIMEGIFSILDTDLYKLTMQSAILGAFPNTYVSYGFTNRTPHLKINQEAFVWLTTQISKLADVRLTHQERDFLRVRCPFLSVKYLDFLASFRFQPATQVSLNFHQELGAIELSIKGLWVETILYEIPLLALISEAYFRFCDSDWSHEGQEDQAYEKGKRLLQNGCLFSDFGTRRRRDYHTHDLVIAGLCRAKSDGLAGALAGTSNVHFAMKYDLDPIGTVAHEWFMGVAAASGDYENANETALRCWLRHFGSGVLSIALTDTFGTPAFLQAFQMDSKVMLDKPSTSRKATFAEHFRGIRQDSGDPKEFVKIMRDFYESQGIHEPKSIVFSDSLNVEKCIEYKMLAEASGFHPTFGVGTFLTNDFRHASNNIKSAPLNIVIKLTSANGQPAIKLSDDMGKTTGDSSTVKQVKKRLGYEDHHWKGGNEEARWESNGAA